MTTDAHRHVTRRDARLEGEPDLEPDAATSDEDERAMKETQRDLTSLSSPLPRGRAADEGPDPTPE